MAIRAFCGYYSVESCSLALRLAKRGGFSLTVTRTKVTRKGLRF